LPNNMSMQQYDYSINGWSQQPDGSWQDDSGQTVTDTAGNILG